MTGWTFLIGDLSRWELSSWPFGMICCDRPVERAGRLDAIAAARHRSAHSPLALPSPPRRRVPAPTAWPCAPTGASTTMTRRRQARRRAAIDASPGAAGRNEGCAPPSPAPDRPSAPRPEPSGPRAWMTRCTHGKRTPRQVTPARATGWPHRRLPGDTAAEPDTSQLVNSPSRSRPLTSPANDPSALRPSPSWHVIAHQSPLLYFTAVRGVRSFRIKFLSCGAMGIRTPDLLHAMNYPSAPRPGHMQPDQPIR
jgi:hypothetical protein